MYRSGEAESLLPVFGTILAFGPEELRSCREGLRALREGEVPLAGGGGSTWVREGELPMGSAVGRCRGAAGRQGSSGGRVCHLLCSRLARWYHHALPVTYRLSRLLPLSSTDRFRWRAQPPLSTQASAGRAAC